MRQQVSQIECPKHLLSVVCETNKMNTVSLGHIYPGCIKLLGLEDGFERPMSVSLSETVWTTLPQPVVEPIFFHLLAC